MDTLTPKDLKDIYDSLPDDLRNSIFSSETSDAYNQIQARYSLDAHQREELSIQSGLLMMGITDPKEYVLVLAEKLGVPRDKAAFIAQEVNRNVLHPVRESLKKVHQPPVLKEEGKVSPMVPTPSTPAAIPTPPPPPIPPPSIPPASIFNQKLGNAFRVPTPPQASVPNYSTPEVSPQTPVPPPAGAPTATPTTPETPRAKDPYRELPL